MSEEEKNELRIVACPGMCNLAKLTSNAAAQVANDGHGKFVKLAGRAKEVKMRLAEAAEGAQEWVLVEGCDYRCGKKFLDREGIQVEKNFLVSSTGIERGIHVVYGDEVVKHVVKAIKAFLDN
ncbi:hypothetical protein GC105_13485 [Alkalibaculum sp. M08DMB]|uniref:Zinc-binding protein n=1 Tax=Alkalibaculum sporogenes TaxID=2655001 RepID=A0A6A7KB96_9FIRM|nr:putative zinc-binding protein [Alkalibaculum sporogenes]MPW26798.1 hypothetical protein [Alkalibaculum sporogenes]